jgi:hypothetical protein
LRKACGLGRREPGIRPVPDVHARSLLALDDLIGDGASKVQAPIVKAPTDGRLIVVRYKTDAACAGTRFTAIRRDRHTPRCPGASWMGCGASVTSASWSGPANRANLIQGAN